MNSMIILCDILEKVKSQCQSNGCREPVVGHRMEWLQKGMREHFAAVEIFIYTLQTYRIVYFKTAEFSYIQVVH